MVAMPPHRPLHLHREKTRHGKLVWYVRVGGSSRGPRLRLRAGYGTAEFWEEYQAALAGRAPKSEPPHAGTLAWLLERYRETTAWTYLSTATRRQRENIFAQILEDKQPFAKITTSVIMAGRDRRSNTPVQARKFLDAMRGLFRWAVKAGLVKVDPTIGIENLRTPKTDGFTVWSEDDVAAYEARWPVGTRQRVWLDVLIYTGLRRGDAVRLGRQHLRNGIATIKTEKSGHRVEVSLPILPVLAKTLEAGPCGDLTFVAGENGHRLAKGSFGNLFRKACNAAGLRGRSAHGLRKAAATRAANAGATVAELEAIFGWSGGSMAALYTRAADRRRFAKGAMHKLANDK